MWRKVLFTLGTMLFLIILLAVLLHIDARREIATQKATGLGVVAPAFDPISSWSTRQSSGVLGAIDGNSPHAMILAADADKSPIPEQGKKVIHTAELTLVVASVDEAAARLRRITQEHKGEIDEVRLWDSPGETRAGMLRVRVPAGQVSTGLALFKQVAVRVVHEQLTATDVTRRYTDNEAQLRNLKAEEQQYLAIMRQARTVKDTLEVAGKLSDVRGEIESLQALINVMAHDIAMSQVTISLSEEEREDALSWRPLRNARKFGRELAGGLATWADTVVGAVILLPVILLWIVTATGVLLIVWRGGRWLWKRRPQ